MSKEWKEPPTLLDRAYALSFDPESQPPPDEISISLGDYPIGARGNITVIQGKSKAGKSAVVSAMLGAAQRTVYQHEGDTLCIDWTQDSAGAIIHIDTEQSPADWHRLARNSVTRSGLPEVSPRLVSLPLVQFTRSERMEVLRGCMKREQEKQGGIDLVMIDGIADLCTSPNDEAEALQLVSEVHALSHTYSCAIACVLHENPTSDQGKTRGHLGSELNRKAFANLRVDKDSETAISTIWGSDMRKRDIPESQGFCFGWDDLAGMHTFKGRAAGIKQAHRDAAKEAEAREFFAPIYGANGTKGACPKLSPEEARAIHRDINGTEKLPSVEAIKKRMQRAESLGVLRKDGRGQWAYIQTGQTGHE